MCAFPRVTVRGEGGCATGTRGARHTCEARTPKLECFPPSALLLLLPATSGQVVLWPPHPRHPLPGDWFSLSHSSPLAGATRSLTGGENSADISVNIYGMTRTTATELKIEHCLV